MTIKGKRNKLTTCRIAELRMFMQTGRKWQVWEPLESYAQLYGYIRGTAGTNGGGKCKAGFSAAAEAASYGHFRDAQRTKNRCELFKG